MLSMQIRSMNKNALHAAADLLRAGKLVAFATETVYGLGGDATNDIAVAEIFALKGRPQFNPLIIHVADVAMAQTIVKWNEAAQILATTFWPGPLTLVLPRSASCKISLLAGAGADTLGVRMPAHEMARTLIQTAGIPVAAPSANRSGRVSPTTAAHVAQEFGSALELILDGGACKVGIESTVLDLSGKTPALLRPGAITRAHIEAVLNQKITVAGEQDGVLKSPGMLKSHYAPSLPVRLQATNVQANEALLAFGDNVPAGARKTLNLSSTGDLKEAAANLFAMLRALDITEYAAIAVVPIPQKDLGVAINDRLKRAAAR